MKYTLKLIIILTPFLTHLQSKMAPNEPLIKKNGMEVTWAIKEDKITFTMNAPTDGWIAIGFNDSENMTGAYLLMGNVINNQPHLVEHYTKSPGNYSPLTNYGVMSRVVDLSGSETVNSTTLEFSLPIHSSDSYSRDLTKGKSYTMTMAFSREDDFQHHSMMRTSVQIKL